MMNMPAPAIAPSSATPRYSAGRKTRKPIAVVNPQSTREAPIPSIALCRAASVGRLCSLRSEAKAIPKWIAKSTPSPMKRIAKAIEIMLSSPIVAAAKAPVQIKPTSSVARDAMTRRQDRNAKYRKPATNKKQKTPEPPISQARPSISSWLSAGLPVKRI